jgi:hypothetical protein
MDVRMIATNPEIVRQELMRTFAFSLALERNLIIPVPKPKLESIAINEVADITADARPTSAGE